MGTMIPPPQWLALKTRLHKQLGFAPPKVRLTLGYVPGTPTGEHTRHLLYFVYPIHGNGVWQRNLDQLKQRLHLFNGQRWIAIASPSLRDHVDSARDVMNHFGFNNANYLLMQHPKRRVGEVIAFASLWDQLKQYRSTSDVTFYGHTKGATKPVNDGISVHRWADLMYRANLDHWDEVASLLKTHATVGAFKKIGWFNGDTRLVKWHYHGSFFWARNDCVFSRNWQHVIQRYGGTEMWPGLLFEETEAACIFYGGDNVNMYSVEEAERAEICMGMWPWPKKDKDTEDIALLIKHSRKL